jgi:AP-3 complex subunit delta-1
MLVKYVGLLALAKITSTHAELVSDLQDLVLACIDDADISIRLRALDLIVGMVSRDSLVDVVKRLMQQLLQPPPDSTAPNLPDHYRIELVRRILAMSTRDNYTNIGNNFEWYVAVLVDLARIANVNVGKELGDEILNVSVRVKSVRPFSLKVLRGLLSDFEVMSGGAEKTQTLGPVLGAAAWIVGEYSRYLSPGVVLIKAYWNIPKLRWRDY